MNVFDGIDFQNLSDEEAVEILKQIKTAQAKLLKYDVRPNYRKGDLLLLLAEDSPLYKRGFRGKYYLSDALTTAILEIADACTNNYEITSKGGKRKNTFVSFEKKDKYINVISDVLEVISKYILTMEDPDEGVRQEGEKELEPR